MGRGVGDQLTEVDGEEFYRQVARFDDRGPVFLHGAVKHVLLVVKKPGKANKIQRVTEYDIRTGNPPEVLDNRCARPAFDNQIGRCFVV